MPVTTAVAALICIISHCANAQCVSIDLFRLIEETERAVMVRSRKSVGDAPNDSQDIFPAYYPVGGWHFGTGWPGVTHGVSRQIIAYGASGWIGNTGSNRRMIGETTALRVHDGFCGSPVVPRILRKHLVESSDEKARAGFTSGIYVLDSKYPPAKPGDIYLRQGIGMARK